MTIYRIGGWRKVTINGIDMSANVRSVDLNPDEYNPDEYTWWPPIAEPDPLNEILEAAGIPRRSTTTVVERDGHRVITAPR